MFSIPILTSVVGFSHRVSLMGKSHGFYSHWVLCFMVFFVLLWVRVYQKIHYFSTKFYVHMYICTMYNAARKILLLVDWVLFKI
jgi:hypothetical protein